MKTRYLASFHEVNTSQPLFDTMGQLMCHTTLQANGKYAAVLTRQQWDTLRATHWAVPTLGGSGFLIPDVDFEALDGTIFANLDDCLAHDLPTLTQGVRQEMSGQEHAILESRIMTAVSAASAGSVHAKDLRALLEVGGDIVKAVVKASKFLVWRGPRVALAPVSTPS